MNSYNNFPPFFSHIHFLCIFVCACKYKTESFGLDNDLDGEPNDFRFDNTAALQRKFEF